MSSLSDPMRPIAPAERIQIIDILRGFALLGILLVNMALFNHSVYAVLFSGFPATTALDQLAMWVIAFLTEGKFYPIFAFLFGVGMAIQMARVQARGGRFFGLYARRQFVLLVIGLIHAYLFWVGDILLLYALLGFVLLIFFRNCRPRTLLIWTVVFLSIAILINAFSWGLIALTRTTPESGQFVEAALAEAQAATAVAAAEADAIYATGSYAAVTRQRIQDMGFVISTWPYWALNVLAMMTMGLAVGKRNLCQDLAAHKPLLRRTLGWGLLVGVVGNLIYVVAGEFSVRSIPSGLTFLSTTGQIVGAPALSLAYMAGLTLLALRPGWSARLAPLAAAGRMAITNYLLQTLICTTLFYGYGFGFYGMGAALSVVLALIIWLLQLAWSVWWLRRFRFGPVEWLWRSLTYMHRQPMRVA